MKLQFRSFLSGALVSALVFGTAVSAFAISGRMTLEVDPINIQVNGQTFVPTDVNGKEVPVFAYQGTTYAPLRALAEAYGLEVGYDQAANMATVADPDAKQAFTYIPQSMDDDYAKFLDLWSMELSADGNWIFLVAKDKEKTAKWWFGEGKELSHDYLWRFADDLAMQYDHHFPTVVVLGSGTRQDDTFEHPYGKVIVECHNG